MNTAMLFLVGVSLTVAGASPDVDKGGEWAKGIPYTTDWDKAIKSVQGSGRLLFIYNGWEKPNI